MATNLITGNITKINGVSSPATIHLFTNKIIWVRSVSAGVSEVWYNRENNSKTLYTLSDGITTVKAALDAADNVNVSATDYALLGRFKRVTVISINGSPVDSRPFLLNEARMERVIDDGAGNSTIWYHDGWNTVREFKVKESAAAIKAGESSSTGS